MINDTSTLNGALTELGETMADNLTTQGVSGATASDGLTTLANKILDIQGGALLLTTNKTILSNYDSETATLTATHTNSTTGLNVAVYNAVSGAKIGDMTDNQDGTYSYTYSSTGTGDISMTCATASLESNSITIEDCLYYSTDGYSNVNAQIPITPPLNFIIDYKVKQTSTSYYGAYMQVGESNKGVLAGQQYSNTVSIFDLGMGTSGRADTNFTFENKRWYHYTFKYENGVFQLSIDDVPVVSYTKTYTTRNYVGVRTESQGYIKEVKIKPL